MEAGVSIASPPELYTAGANNKNINGSYDDLLEERRERVASMRLRGRSTREIAKEIGVSHVTVSKDILVVEARWQASILKSVTDLKARQFNDLAEIRRAAWAESPPDFDILIACVKREAALLGLDEPERKTITVESVERLKVALVTVSQEFVPPDRLEEFYSRLGQLVSDDSTQAALAQPEVLEAVLESEPNAEVVES